MLIHLQALLGFGCLGMHSLGTLLGLLLVKNKITFSGSSGSVLVTLFYCCYHGFLVFLRSSHLPVTQLQSSVEL